MDKYDFDLLFSVIDIACDEYAQLYAEVNQCSLKAGRIRMQVTLMRGIMAKEGIEDNEHWQKVKDALAKVLGQN